MIDPLVSPLTEVIKKALTEHTKGVLNKSDLTTACRAIKDEVLAQVDERVEKHNKALLAEVKALLSSQSPIVDSLEELVHQVKALVSEKGSSKAKTIKIERDERGDMTAVKLG